MKRITVQITVQDAWPPAKFNRVGRAMINAAVAKCTEEDLEIAEITQKTGNVRSVKR